MFDTEPTSESTARPDEFEESIATVLSSPVRKRVLAILARTGDHHTFSDLASSVSDGEDEDGAREPAEVDEHPRTVLLYHRDLPKLADHELVEWDSDANRVALTTRGTACAAALGL